MSYPIAGLKYARVFKKFLPRKVEGRGDYLRDFPDNEKRFLPYEDAANIKKVVPKSWSARTHSRNNFNKI